MLKLSENEWAILNVLWKGESFSLGKIHTVLSENLTWSKNTLHTYLTRMNSKGLVEINKSSKTPYSAKLTKQECAAAECEALVTNAYDGQASLLVSAFLKSGKISKEERDNLLNLLDNMEV